MLQHQKVISMPEKISKRYSSEQIAETLREARMRKGWSQRELSARAHMTQAQISRIENGDVDLQLSSLVELARSLDLDVQLVPRGALTAVAAVVKETDDRSRERAARDTLNQLVGLAAQAEQLHPYDGSIAVLGNAVRELLPIAPLLANQFATSIIRASAEKLERLIDTNEIAISDGRAVLRLARELRDLRNSHVHASSLEERPAYSLDDED